MSAADDQKQRAPKPEWLIGLLIAVVAFAVIVWVVSVFEVGDDPTLGEAVRLRSLV